MRPQAPRSGAGAGFVEADTPGPGPTPPTRRPCCTSTASRRSYAAVVDGYIDWQTAIVDAVLRASVSGEKAMHFRGHERCLSALASLLQFTNAYRQGRDWSCECRYCRFMGGLRNYLAHHWTRDDESFALSGGQWRTGSV